MIKPGDRALLAQVPELKAFSPQKGTMITVSDAAILVCKQDGKVKVKQANNLGGAFWGNLIDLLFWAPTLGLADR